MWLRKATFPGSRAVHVLFTFLVDGHCYIFIFSFISNPIELLGGEADFNCLLLFQDVILHALGCLCMCTTDKFPGRPGQDFEQKYQDTAENCDYPEPRMLSSKENFRQN